MKKRDLRIFICSAIVELALFIAMLPLFTRSELTCLYLDPSTGSMIVSAIIGIFAAVGLALKTFWYKITNIFKGKKK